MAADVDDTLPDWSTTESGNKPTGATSISTNLDDNLRMIQKVVRGWLASKGSDIASASTTDLGAVEGLMHDITGTTTITSFGTVAAGILKVVKFEGALTLTHNSTSLILPGGANITTADGDIALMISEGSGNWRCVSYFPATGKALAQTPTLATEQAATSGTSIDFTSIPSWVKKITIMLIGVSTSGSSNVIVRIGDSGGFESTGYVYGITQFVHGGSFSVSDVTDGFYVTTSVLPASTLNAKIVLTLEDADNFHWVASMQSYLPSNTSNFGVGNKATSAALDRVQVTTVSGTATFDAGSINILYE